MSEQRQTEGISGRIARAFLTTEITPLLALTGILLGLFAMVITPREEEPQINVTFANVFIPFPGASAEEVESLITIPAEQIVSEIDGVKHVYSTSTPGMASLTVRFLVGEDRTDAIVRLYNAFYSNQDWQPQNLGVGSPLIKPKGIDDVPIFAATLWSRNPDLTSEDLTRIARTLSSELQRIDGTRDIEILTGAERVLHVEFDPSRLATLKLSLDDIRNALAASNTTVRAGTMVSGNRSVLVETGSFLMSSEEVGELVVGITAGAPTFLRDVATITHTTDHPERYVSFGTGPASKTASQTVPAVTLSISKKPGENAIRVAEDIVERLNQLKGIHIPDDIEVTITRNYGETSQEKASTLIQKLMFATISVVALVLLTLGRREAFVVGAAVVVTLLITLFASWAWGFTVNRVSLFALIFSIGILVDDAIVVVENIHRHMAMGSKTLKEAIPLAVDEVGGPTILATLTVIAALLPMAFVSGLMGPYMRPIPINASSGMLISLAVAFIFTPWLYYRLFRHVEHEVGRDDEESRTTLQAFFARLLTPFLRKSEGVPARWGLLAGLITLIAASVSLVAINVVIMKMLPFDNKSELQILVDMPEGTPVEATNRVLQDLSTRLLDVPEVLDYQLYAGTSAPINFNGLVRQYYLRAEPHLGDIQVNLVDKSERDRKSHDIAVALREKLAGIGEGYGANIKVVEVPPGPPVLAPLVAEIYGPNYEGQMETAKEVREIFESAQGVVDIDDTLETPQEKLLFLVDRARAAKLGVSQQAIAQTLSAALSGEDMSYLHSEHLRKPTPVRVELPASLQSDLDQLTSLRVRSTGGALVPLSELVSIVETTRDQTIHRKDLLPVVYVTGDVAGSTESPLYGLASIATRLPDSIEQYFTSQPPTTHQYSLKWDGEWQVTYDTFRDMGIAYAAGLVLIYLLVVAQFRSYGVPLIIMAPIPLTMIGILPGHALLGQQFTAPSMIGMIALAGIIVRNSILLVDFIQQSTRAGEPLEQATVSSAAVRARPIALTAVAAMLGGFFILDDPIFGGLAVSLIFGLFVSTVLTLIVIPIVYYHFHWRAAEETTPG